MHVDDQGSKVMGLRVFSLRNSARDNAPLIWVLPNTTRRRADGIVLWVVFVCGVCDFTLHECLVRFRVRYICVFRPSASLCVRISRCLFGESSKHNALEGCRVLCEFVSDIYDCLDSRCACFFQSICLFVDSKKHTPVYGCCVLCFVPDNSSSVRDSMRLVRYASPYYPAVFVSKKRPMFMFH